MYKNNYIDKEYIESKSMPYGVCDFETTVIKEGIQKFLCGGIFDSNYFRYYEDIESFIEYLCKSNHKIYFFHNLSYDYRFILEYLLENFNLKIIPRESQILKIIVYDKVLNYRLFELRDSYALLPISLKKISKSFCKNYVKQDIDIENIELLFKENKEQVKYYLKLDCLSLYDGLTNFLKLINAKDINLTIGCLAFQNWKRYYKEQGGKITNLYSNQKYDMLFRRTYYGGRCEVFKRKCEEGFYYDVNSMYPYVMKSNEFPIGKITKLNKEHQYFIADVTINIPNSLYIPPIPYRHNGKLYFPTGKIKGWYNSVDIKLCQDLGCKVKIHSGFGWNESEALFHNFVSHYYKLKLKGEIENNKGLYYLSKLILNSAYGKFGQNSLKSIITTFDNFSELYKLCNEFDVYSISDKYKLYNIIKPDNKNYSTTYISSFITSLARKHLFELMYDIIESGYNVYYCDTDSIVTDKLLKDSKNLGELKRENDIKDGYFALPKLYGYKNNKEEIVLKGKGLAHNTLKYKDIKDFVENKTTIVNSCNRISTIKHIMNNKLFFTECYKLLRHVAFNPEMYKRKLHGKYDTIPFNTHDLK